jgi:hypothetical protein
MSPPPPKVAVTTSNTNFAGTKNEQPKPLFPPNPELRDDFVTRNDHNGNNPFDNKPRNSLFGDEEEGSNKTNSNITNNSSSTKNTNSNSASNTSENVNSPLPVPIGWD